MASIGPVYCERLFALPLHCSIGPIMSARIETVPTKSIGTVEQIRLEAPPIKSGGAVVQLELGSKGKFRLKQLNLVDKQDNFTVAAPVGQGVPSIYTLTATPAYDASVLVFRTGKLQRQGIDYTISGTTVTYQGTLALTTADYFVIRYVSQS